MKGMVERPFAYCCAEAGGHVDACDCVNKNHGTAWFSAPAKAIETGTAETVGLGAKHESAGPQGIAQGASA